MRKPGTLPPLTRDHCSCDGLTNSIPGPSGSPCPPWSRGRQAIVYVRAGWMRCGAREVSALYPKISYSTSYDGNEPGSFSTFLKCTTLTWRCERRLVGVGASSCRSINSLVTVTCHRRRAWCGRLRYRGPTADWRAVIRDDRVTPRRRTGFSCSSPTGGALQKPPVAGAGCPPVAPSWWLALAATSRRRLTGGVGPGGASRPKLQICPFLPKPRPS